jgi:hypothetical protein
MLDDDAPDELNESLQINVIEKPHDQSQQQQIRHPCFGSAPNENVRHKNKSCIHKKAHSLI